MIGKTNALAGGNLQFASGTVRTGAASTGEKASISFSGLSFKPKFVWLHYIVQSQSDSNSYLIYAPEYTFGRRAELALYTCDISYANGTCTVTATPTMGYRPFFYFESTYYWYAWG